MKKQKRILIIILTLVFSFIIPVSVNAEPKTMPDGTVFDPSFYAMMNPDVVNVYGTSTERLYQHYVKYGKKEGRQPVYGAQAQTVLATSNYKAGDMISFGGFIWRVLEVNADKVLILSECVLNVSCKYHNEFTQITWEDSDTRKYLNEVFYNNLSPTDQMQIADTLVSTPNDSWYGTYGGNDTIDKIFLLSREEVVKYFGDSGKFANPTKNNGRYPDLPKDFPIWWMNDKYDSARKAYDIYGNAANWWLRSPGSYSKDGGPVITAACIGDDGLIGYLPVTVDNPQYPIGIRPALWMKLK